MKLNQKIMEAINEGIRKSLLSFDDVEFSQSDSNRSNKKISTAIKDWKWIQDNCVDLGLPSGTLWCKWNIGATNGDMPESWYGHHYAWGETEPKSKYISKNYTYKERTHVLPDDKDIAYLANNLMHMPTKEQVEELMALPSQWVENYNGITNLNGGLFIGTNGNKLFIPANGFYRGSKFYEVSSCCCLWTSSLQVNDPVLAWCIYVKPYNIGTYVSDRYRGLSVRGVVDKK